MLSQAPAPMLAQLESRLPVGEQWRYEPKLDGFRGRLWRRANGQVQLLSRNGRDLAAWFLELVRAAVVLPHGTLLNEVELICELLPPDRSPVHIVGHSFGGVVALGLALTNPSVASLTLIEPVAFFVLCHAHESEAYAEISGIRDSFLRELEMGRGEEALRGFLGYWTGPGSWDAIPERARDELLRCVEKLRLDFDASFNTDPGVEAIRGVAVPTLLVQGTKSTLPARRVVATLSEMLPRAELQLVNDANHLLAVTHATVLTDSVLRHLHAAGSTCITPGLAEMKQLQLRRPSVLRVCSLSLMGPRSEFVPCTLMIAPDSTSSTIG